MKLYDLPTHKITLTNNQVADWSKLNSEGYFKAQNLRKEVFLWDSNCLLYYGTRIGFTETANPPFGNVSEKELAQLLTWYQV